MNKKVVLQVGCFLVMFVLEMIAAYVNPASVMHNALLILMIPAFVLVGRVPKAVKHETVVTESPLEKAA